MAASLRQRRRSAEVLGRGGTQEQTAKAGRVTPLDTRQVPNGMYLVSVGAADTCENRSTLTERIRIANRPSHPPLLAD